MDDPNKKSSIATNKSTSNNTSNSAEESVRVQLTNKHNVHSAPALPDDEAFNIDDYDDDDDDQYDDEDDEDQCDDDNDYDQFIDDDDDLIEVKYIVYFHNYLNYDQALIFKKFKINPTARS